MRIPAWLDRDEVNIEGTETPPVWTNAYLFFSEVSTGQAIQLRFPLKEAGGKKGFKKSKGMTVS